MTFAISVAAQTRTLFFRACGDCHSNQTVWPWYSSIAPISWLVQRDVQEGRREFNVSEWGRPRNKADEAAETVQKGSMPPWFSIALHPSAKLSPSERQELITGLIATFGSKQGGMAPSPGRAQPASLARLARCP